MKKKKKKHSYTISLCFSLLLVFAGSFLVGSKEQQGSGSENKSAVQVEAGEGTIRKTESIENYKTVRQEQPYQTAEEATGEALRPLTENENAAVTSKPEKKAEDHVKESGLSRENGFTETLFIGDSRTVGLVEYGELDEADVYADPGMTVYDLEDAELTVGEKGKLRLDELLSSTRYQNIYIMLGINELGYDYNHLVQKYKTTVKQIASLQPEARIVLQANLHVSKAKSDADSIYNNPTIDRLNQDIKAFAEQEQYEFLDVNELFDDESGNLNQDDTNDGFHVKAKHYSEWMDWLWKKVEESKASAA